MNLIFRLQELSGQNSNDSSNGPACPGTPNSQGMRPTPSPTGSTGSRSMSPAVGPLIFCFYLHFIKVKVLYFSSFFFRLKKLNSMYFGCNFVRVFYMILIREIRINFCLSFAGQQNVQMPPRPSSSQSDGNGPARMSHSPMTTQGIIFTLSYSSIIAFLIIL